MSGKDALNYLAKMSGIGRKTVGRSVQKLADKEVIWIVEEGLSEGGTGGWRREGSLEAFPDRRAKLGSRVRGRLPLALFRPV